jgi:TPR repeat protein
MKLNRFLLFSLLLCFVFPVLSNAEQLEDAKAAVENKDFEKAYELLCPLAEEDNAEAQTILGSLYINGQGVEKDITKGLSWIMKAATQGYELARVRALNLCMDIAKQGDAAAMYNVGYMCLNGWGGEQDANDCIEWLETAAKLGHIRSAKVLSQIYTKGSFGITPDEEKASHWSDLATAFAAGFDG